MRKARGQIDALPGIFHIESELHPDQPRLTQTQAELYEKWLFGLTEINGFDLLFWQFHASGFSIILETGKISTPENSKLAAGFDKIGEAMLSAHLMAPEACPLIPSDASRLKRYLSHYRNTTELAKGLKQRIARQHNRENRSRGTIWSDRMRLYRLPSRAHDLVEVAAFIFATPSLLDLKSPRDWPGSYRSANAADGIARRGLKRIFRNRLDHKDNLQTLIERSAGILQQVKTYQEGKTRSSGRRGRKTQWRPYCETTEQQEAQKTGPAPISSKEQAEQAKRRFNRMLRKFENFKETTGETTLPHGYTGDIDLRTWANQQRGLFKSGRLAQWKVDLLKPSGLLDPPTSGISYLSADGQHRITHTWLERYEALKSFHKAHGHSRITRRDEQNKTLANWVWQQRAKRRKSQLLPKQIELLDEIEFCWNPRSRI